MCKVQDGGVAQTSTKALVGAFITLYCPNPLPDRKVGLLASKRPTVPSPIVLSWFGGKVRSSVSVSFKRLLLLRRDRRGGRHRVLERLRGLGREGRRSLGRKRKRSRRGAAVRLSGTVESESGRPENPSPSPTTAEGPSHGEGPMKKRSTPKEGGVPKGKFRH